MESVLPSPYNLSNEGEYGYTFITKDSIKFHAYFIEASYMHHDFCDVYSFNIEPKGSRESQRHHIDARIAATVIHILSMFFASHKNAMIVVCDSCDGKELKQRKLFDRWFQNYNNNRLIKLDASIQAEGYILLVSMYIDKDNTRKATLISAFNDLIRTDLFGLGV